MWAHALGWLIAALVAWAQPWGLTAADTKHDLAVDPAGFLAQALTPYTDTFTLGQMQNQAYGYLFPQGAFFLLTDFLPDWMAQRAWWTLVIGVGWSGALAVARRAGLSTGPAMLAAFAFALSPRTLTTLTAISSETWPVMLAPWVVYPFLADRITRREVAAAVLPVAAMGAVNATATAAACVPAAVVLLYRRAWRPLVGWLAGCALVSVWWIGPLLILGTYSPPFTNYIESSFVTTRWLNLTEILRGTTSWAPFVEDERVAGHLLATHPAFVLFTALLAAVGLAGLTRAPRVWPTMLVVGVAILGCSWGFYLEFLDGPGAALRNLHKFDPVVRLPLALGVGFALSTLVDGSKLSAAGRRLSAAALVVGLAAASASPAWTGRMLPRGAYEAVPTEWAQAAEFLNANARGTRTLIYPQRSFAREDWGWTRDEPLQPLLDVPWAVRDAIPLVPPEAIRGLDGLMAATAAQTTGLDITGSLQRLGIGAVIVRNEDAPRVEFPGKAHRFGDLTVWLLDERPDMLLTADSPVRVAGGGEALAFLPAGPYELVDGDAQVVTDSPLAVDRNYGTLDGPVSAPLAQGDPSTVRNKQRDYTSAGQRVWVHEEGGHVAASSSAADAAAFGGADPSRSVTAAVDGRDDTAWWPAPGQLGWLELRGDFPARTRVELSATQATTVKVSSGEASVDVVLAEDTPRTVTVPGGVTDAIRFTLTQRVGLNVQAVDRPVTRVVTVPDSSPNVQVFAFQRLTVDTGVLIREFTAPRRMEVTLDANRWVTIDGRDYHPGARLILEPGQHRLESRADWATLVTDDMHWGSYSPTGRDIAPAAQERLLVTTRAANPGLRAYLEPADAASASVELAPRIVDAATQAFVVPAGASGRVRIEFAATPLYRGVLVIGGMLALLTAAACLWILSARRPRQAGFGDARRGLAWPVAVVALGLVGWPALAGGVAGWAAARFTSLRPAYLAGGLLAAAGAMLARAPWTAPTYAGDSWLTMVFAAAALGAVAAAGADQARVQRRTAT